MTTTTLRRLPSVDWIAFGVGIAALVLHHVYPPLFGVIALAVFAPSLLRELGVLKDADEWTVGIMHRAGFHGLLAVGGLIFLNHMAAATGLWEPAPNDSQPLPHETLRKAVIWVFLVSYIIQYWGAREGVFRVLVVTALAGLAPLAAWNQYASQGREFTLALVGATLAHTVIIGGVALLVRRRPRVGGAVLLAMLIAVIAFGATTMAGAPSAAQWGMFAVWLQGGLIFGITGVALFRETAEN